MKRLLALFAVASLFSLPAAPAVASLPITASSKALAERQAANTVRLFSPGRQQDDTDFASLFLFSQRLKHVESR